MYLRAAAGPGRGGDSPKISPLVSSPCFTPWPGFSQEPLTLRLSLCVWGIQVLFCQKRSEQRLSYQLNRRQEEEQREASPAPLDFSRRHLKPKNTTRQFTEETTVSGQETWTSSVTIRETETFLIRWKAGVRMNVLPGLVRVCGGGVYPTLLMEI